MLEKKCVLSSVKGMVWYKIEGVEVTLTHQRYMPMEETEMETIYGIKERLDRVEQEELSKICVGVVNECLEKRRA